MKVGILTFHRAHNCGAMLQNYALQTVLKRIGAEPFTIDFNRIGEERRFANLSVLTIKQRILRAIQFFFSIGIFDLRLYRFNRFRKRNLQMTGRVAAGEWPSDFDFYIVGSDQVFQPNLTRQHLKAFLLEGVLPKKRISYAASFGYESLPEAFRSMYKENLALFHAISVREESGARIIKKELGLDVPVEVVLDPTLLLDSVEYEKIETRVRVSEKYVLVYSIGGVDAKLREVANDVANRMNAKVMFVNACRRSYFRTPHNDLLAISPDRLLYLVRNAAYVVTTSFHGVAFSLIYRRQFTAIIPKNSKVAGRIPALLNRLGIPERATAEISPIDRIREQYDSRIDYNAVVERLGTLRKASLGFLQSALGMPRTKSTKCAKEHC